MVSRTHMSNSNLDRPKVPKTANKVDLPLYSTWNYAIKLDWSSAPKLPFNVFVFFPPAIGNLISWKRLKKLFLIFSNIHIEFSFYLITRSPYIKVKMNSSALLKNEKNICKRNRRKKSRKEIAKLKKTCDFKN